MRSFDGAMILVHFFPAAEATNAVTPIPVTLDGHSHSVSLPLEIVTATATRGSRFALQLAAQSTLYNTHARGGSITFSDVRVSLPMVKAAKW